MKNETARREIESLDYYLQNHTDDYSEESHTAMMMAVKVLEQEPSVTSQPKTGHWVYKIYGEFHEQGDWYCSHCDYQYNFGNGHAKYCPECGYEMSEAPTEEVMSEYDRRRCNYPNDI